MDDKESVNNQAKQAACSSASAQRGASAPAEIEDSAQNHWVYRLLPAALIPYAQLGRWERPIGWQLLLWPCLWSLWAAAYYIVANDFPELLAQPASLVKPLFFYSLLFILGAFIMRGAGCSYNDLLDHKLDAKVARTKNRPLPSGRLSRRAAKLFLLLQLAGGLFILWQFNYSTILLGASSLFLIIIYPLMKRIMAFPQLILGLAFNWGALLGWSSLLSEFSAISLLLYIAAVFWTMGYDTIYAHQDREDDKEAQIKSSALLLASYSRLFVSLCYVISLLCFAFIYLLLKMPAICLLWLFLAAGQFFWQISKLDIDNRKLCHELFRSNFWPGLYFFLFFVTGLLVKLA